MSTALIISTSEIIINTRAGTYFLNFGIGFLFELLVIFDRLSSILNIKDDRMIKVNELGSESP